MEPTVFKRNFYLPFIVWWLGPKVQVAFKFEIQILFFEKGQIPFLLSDWEMFMKI